MEGFANHLRDVSVLDYLTNDLWVMVAGYMLLLINLCFTFVHTNEERTGRLWDYFGRVEGVRFADWIGVFLFFIVLTLTLWALGIGAITAHLPILDITLGDEGALACVGAIIGVRTSDSLYSHVWLNKRYRKYARNPGLRSTPLYLVEAALLAVVFAPGFGSSLTCAGAAGVGFAVGWLFFASIRPGIRSLRFVERLRQERWIPDAG